MNIVKGKFLFKNICQSAKLFNVHEGIRAALARIRYLGTTNMFYSTEQRLGLFPKRCLSIRDGIAIVLHPHWHQTTNVHLCCVAVVMCTCGPEDACVAGFCTMRVVIGFVLCEHFTGFAWWRCFHCCHLLVSKWDDDAVESACLFVQGHQWGRYKWHRNGLNQGLRNSRWVL